MHKQKMEEQIINGINHGKSLLELRNEIIQFKNNGGTQELAIEILSRIRFKFIDEETKEDIALELLDLASGWCQNELKIWK